MTASNTRKILYFIHGGTAVYDLVRSHVPPGFDLVTLEQDSDAERLAKLRDAEVVVVGSPKLERRHVDAAPDLKLVHHQGVGYHDTVDVAALTERGIPLAIAPGGTGEGVSEHTIMLMLAVCKRLAYVDAEMRRGVFHYSDLRPESRQLYGKTVGIVGMGRIGREVARRLLGFGVTLLYHDIVPAGLELEREFRLTRTDMDELLAKSDVVTLHVPLTPETFHMIDRAALAAMKAGTMLINCARGPVVSETALIEALRSGRLGGAGLDVFEQEPPQHPMPLAEFHNVVMTPHIAPGTVDAMHMKLHDVFANVQRLYAGEAVAEPDRVSGEVG